MLRLRIPFLLGRLSAIKVQLELESQNDPIKLKISQSKVYLTKQHKGSNDPVKQYNKYDVLSDSDSEMSCEESPITNSQGRSGNKNVNNGTKQK